MKKKKCDGRAFFFEQGFVSDKWSRKTWGTFRIPPDGGRGLPLRFASPFVSLVFACSKKNAILLMSKKKRGLNIRNGLQNPRGKPLSSFKVL